MDKVCNKCNELKPLDQFHRQAKGAGGHKAICKDCRHLKRVKQWINYKANSTSEERHERYLKNKTNVDKWMSDPVNKKQTAKRKLERNRRIVAASTLEERRARRLKCMPVHKKAKSKYKAKIKREKLTLEVKNNEALYLVIKAELEAGCFKKDILLVHGLSHRFLNRLLKYEGHCYKAETVIDRIQPILNKHYNCLSFREHTWPWLRSPLSQYPMRVDLFYPDKNLAIEFNGPQHYREIGYGNLAEVQIRDEVKYQLLEEYGIELRVFTKEEEVLKLQ